MRLVAIPAQPVPDKHRAQRHWPYVTLGILLLAAALNLARPLPAATVTLSVPRQAAAEALQLAWPDSGQAAVAAKGYGLLATHGTDTPLATASIAKVITALCVLEKHPLKTGEAGPTITFGSNDAAFYAQELARGGSSIPVYNGSTASEYEALTALMLPSANNMADSLAVWAFGSLENYAAYANAYLARHGLVRTHVGSDASGYDPSTTSTAQDLARLGLVALDQPVLMQIAGQKSATLDSFGTVYNYNSALGNSGINGIKTGNNDQNPGALLFSAKVHVGSETISVTGAVMAASSLPAATQDSENLVNSMGQNFESYSLATAHQAVGQASTAWASKTAVRTLSGLSIVRWKGSPVRIGNTLNSTTGGKGTVGALAIESQGVRASTTLTITEPAAKPSFWWRLTRLH